MNDDPFGLDNAPKGAPNIGNLSDINRFGAYAYFPGSGPAGKACVQCRFFFSTGKSKKTCSQYAHMKGTNPHRAPAISGNTQACEYYEAKDAPR